MRDTYSNLSVLDNRYWDANKKLFDALSSCFSEAAMVSTYVAVEKTLVECHLGRDILIPEISPYEVFEEEQKTHHNIKALVNVICRKVPEHAHLVHLGATSADIQDTGRALAMKKAVNTIVLPLLRSVEIALCKLALKEATTIQAGRTHGQQAVPITFGFAMTEYVSRLGQSIFVIEALNERLVGKLSGATGSYNAMSLLHDDPQQFERIFLRKLGLSGNDHSTQIVHPEPMLRLLLEMNIAFGILANLSDDLRNLQRTEINEVRESFGEHQVGSSTMPQKHNPWNSEHIKSMWKEFSPRVVTFYMDQISEHQRDLTNSASQRFIPEYVCGFCEALARELEVITNLVVDREQMKKNIRPEIYAEEKYIKLAKSGIVNAHSIVMKDTKTEAAGDYIGQSVHLTREVASRYLSLIEGDTLWS